MPGSDQCQSPSVLFDGPADGAADARAEPVFFADLNLDQVLEQLTAGRAGYDLAPFFYTPLRDPQRVRYRHEVMRDLEADCDAVRVLAAGLAGTGISSRGLAGGPTARARSGCRRASRCRPATGRTCAGRSSACRRGPRPPCR